eukprot:2718271-Rhodomonas_salina.2
MGLGPGCYGNRCLNYCALLRQLVPDMGLDGRGAGGVQSRVELPGGGAAAAHARGAGVLGARAAYAQDRAVGRPSGSLSSLCAGLMGWRACRIDWYIERVVWTGVWVYRVVRSRPSRYASSLRAGLMLDRVTCTVVTTQGGAYCTAFSTQRDLLPRHRVT